MCRGRSARVEIRSTGRPRAASRSSASVTKSSPISGSTSTRMSMSLRSVSSPRANEPNRARSRTPNRRPRSGFIARRIARISSRDRTIRRQVYPSVGGRRPDEPRSARRARSLRNARRIGSPSPPLQAGPCALRASRACRRLPGSGDPRRWCYCWCSASSPQRTSAIPGSSQEVRHAASWDRRGGPWWFRTNGAQGDRTLCSS